MFAISPLTVRSRIFIALLPALLLFSRAVADITVLLVGLVFLWFCHKNKDWSWANTTWFKSVMVFWLSLILINLPFSIDPQESLLYVLTFIRWPLFAIAIAYWVLGDLQRQRWFFWALMLTSLFIVADTFWQYFFDYDWFGIHRFSENRLTGPFRNPVPGTMMVRLWFILGFAIYFMAYLNKNHAKTIYLLSLFTLGLAFFFITGERMAFLVFLSGTAVCLLGMLLTFKEQRKQILMGLAFIALSFVTISQLDPVMTERTIASTVEKLANFRDSDYGEVFTSALTAWQQHPLLGSGMHTYRSACEGIALNQGADLNCSHPHNLYLHIAAETGLVGLVLFVTMLVMLYIHILRPFIQTKDWLQAALCFCVLSASFWPMIGGKSVLNNWVAALVWLGVGWCLSRAKLATQKEQLN